ncbi:ABC transporter substrate-binding protein [Cohnella rhizosphaerae]|uniref:Extracellular solute-binding protein n=1 Tax=Cohnella rhizosphaerae TaxID=1457232 RepID=A0A9X4QRH6_9BACL|nr:extracellular solute-binding protein [Cohnella rhizosphaerae]MDG0808585.1 extracellular solute-binding protein [Cohnella rhizosphaerae]
MKNARTRKSVQALIPASILALGLLAACGSNSDAGGSGASGGSNGGSAENTETASAASGTASGTATASGAPTQDTEAFSISVASWNLGDEPLGIVKAYREAFEKAYKVKYPNATIEYKNTPGEAYFDLLKAQMASASAADVVQFQSAQLPLFAKAGYIADLSDMPFVANIDGAPKTQSSYGGKVYAAPFDLNSNGVWYNRKLFEDNGIQVPKTWDELMQTAETLKAKGIAPFAGGFKDAWVASMTVSVFLPNEYGSDTFEKDVYNGAKKLNGPEIQAAFNKLQTLVDKGYFGSNALSNGWDLQRKDFEDGKAAMIIHGPYIGGLVNSEMKDQGGMETGFFALPSDKGDPTLSVSVGVLTGVNAHTKNLKRAKDLVTAMHDTDAIIIRDKDAGVFPAIKGIEIDYKEIGNKDFLSVLGSTKSMIQGQFMPASVGDVYAKMFTKMLAGKAFSPSWLDEADSAFTRDKGLVAPPEQ